MSELCGVWVESYRGKSAFRCMRPKGHKAFTSDPMHSPVSDDVISDTLNSACLYLARGNSELAAKIKAQAVRNG